MATYPSELTLSEVLTKTNNFSPVKVFYNGEVIWDDELYVENYIPYHKAIINYKKKNKYFNYYKVTNINIEITDYHHIIVYISGYTDIKAINKDIDRKESNND